MALMAKTNTIFIIILGVICSIFFLAVGFDLTPYLRGPAPYPPEWRWQYQFTNTFSHVWLPLLVITFLFGLWLIFEKQVKKKQEISNKREWIFLLSVLLLAIAIELSFLFFSRSGVGVLISRIILPGANGYFSQSLKVSNVSLFLDTFTKQIIYFPMRAADHPPFAVLFFSCWNWVASLLLPFFPGIKTIHIAHSDIATVFNSLPNFAKLGAMLATGAIITLSVLWVVPLYFFTKKQYGRLAAVRVSVIAPLTAGIVLFLPLNDVFLPLVSIGCLFFIQKGLMQRKFFFPLAAGVLWSIGTFFSISLIPVGIILVGYLLTQGKKNITPVCWFLFGSLLLPCILFLTVRFNTIDAFFVITKRQANRSYLPWVFYNLLDVIIFAGLPISIASMWACWHVLRRKMVKKYILLLLTVGTILLLDVSGFSRAEAGRIWLPIYIFLIPVLVGWITFERKLSTKLFSFFLFFVCLQLFVLTEFWVTLW